MKCPSETLQNLPYFIYATTQSCFFRFSFQEYFIFLANDCPGLCRHRPGHSLGEKIKQHEMKTANLGFRIYKIGQILKRFAGSFYQV